MRTLRCVSAGVVVRHFLAHEHVHHNRHAQVAQRFGLHPNGEFPTRSSFLILELLPLVEGGSSQAWVALFASHATWELRALNVLSDLSALSVMVAHAPYDESSGRWDRLPAQLPHWRNFLKAGVHPRAAADAINHRRILDTLAQAQPKDRLDVLEPVIVNQSNRHPPTGRIWDGGHRSLGAYDYATQHQAQDLEIRAFCALD